MRVAPPLLVDPGDAVVLYGWMRDPTAPALARRAQIVLLCHDGHGPEDVLSPVALRWRPGDHQAASTGNDRPRTARRRKSVSRCRGLPSAAASSPSGLNCSK